MRFILNFNVSPSMLEALSRYGHTARRAMSEEPDEVILASAMEQGAIVITCDLDFGALVHKKHLPHAGIVQFRLRRNTAQNQLRALTAAIDDGRVVPGAFVVLTDVDAR